MSKPSTATLNSVLVLESNKYRKSVDRRARTRCIISSGRARMQVNSSDAERRHGYEGRRFWFKTMQGVGEIVRE
jgi:hypothetical protein